MVDLSQFNLPVVVSPNQIVPVVESSQADAIEAALAKYTLVSQFSWENPRNLTTYEHNIGVLSSTLSARLYCSLPGASQCGRWRHLRQVWSEER
jgi:hypothetical protein